MEVEKLSIWFEHLETVSAALRDEEHVRCVRAELKGEMPQECG
jgi:hypothetical protein